MPSKLMSIILDPENLYQALKKASRQGGWKDLMFKALKTNCFSLITKTIDSVSEGNYQIVSSNDFEIYERGKPRHIKSLDIKDMMLQRSLCDNAILPRIRPLLIYDNGASLEGKGISFSRERFERHLTYMKNRKSDFYILFGDFSKFFDNIRHDLLKENFRTLFPEDDVYELISKCIDYSVLDVSYMTDEEYEYARNGVFNTLDHYKRIKEYKGPSGLKYLHKGLGIGAQLSQSAGIWFPTPFDRFCKDKLGVKCYGRYMDDFYIMSDNLEYLKSLRPLLQEEASKIGLTLNEKKFRNCKMSCHVTYLKIKYYFDKKGKLHRKFNRDILYREIRKLKKFKQMVLTSKMTLDSLCIQMKGWLGNYDSKKYDNAKHLIKVKRLFVKLYADYITLQGKEKHKKFLSLLQSQT